MVYTVVLLNVFISTCVLAFPESTGRETRSVHETPENIIAAGYHAERHHVVTSDGYILEMHRVPFKRGMRDGDPARPVVFLMHGLMAASNLFIDLGPEYSIPFNLADAGFDVWMGNARGTKNSRYHVSMDPEDREQREKFFDFTWEEIGIHDVPAMVDYALVKTGKRSLHYVGHSQGGTVFLVLNSMRPEYNEKFMSAHLMAGVGYMNYFPSALLRIIAERSDAIHSLALSLGLVELFPPIASIVNNMGNYSEETMKEHSRSDFCTGDLKMKSFCDLIGIGELIHNNNAIIDLIQDNEPGGASVKQIVHFGHNVRDQTFSRWNFGPSGNMEHYGSEVPPSYNISLISTKVIMHYTISDPLLDERDVKAMAEDMPNAEIRRIERDDFRHMDFIAANDVRDLVTVQIIKDIWEIEMSDNTPSTGGSTSILISSVLKMYLIVLLLG